MRGKYNDTSRRVTFFLPQFTKRIFQESSEGIDTKLSSFLFENETTQFAITSWNVVKKEKTHYPSTKSFIRMNAKIDRLAHIPKSITHSSSCVSRFVGRIVSLRYPSRFLESRLVKRSVSKISSILTEC